MSKALLIRELINTKAWALRPSMVQDCFPLVHNILTRSAIEIEIDDKEENQWIQAVASERGPVLAKKFNSSNVDFSSEDKPIYALIPVKGVLTKQDGWCSYGSKTIASWIRSANANPNVKGIILEIESGGGSTDAISVMRTAITEATNQPIIAFIDGCACSAAYFIASACQEIYCLTEMDMVGSLGTYATLADYKKYYESQGLKVHEIYATDSTEKNLDIREAFDGKYEMLQKELIDPLNDNFITSVKADRAGKTNEKDYPGIFKGQEYFAKDALKAGLIDGIKSLQQVVERLDELTADSGSESNTQQKLKSDTMKKTTILATQVALVAALGITFAEGETSQEVELTEELVGKIESHMTGLTASIKKAEKERDDFKAERDALQKKVDDGPGEGHTTTGKDEERVGEKKATVSIAAPEEQTQYSTKY